MGTLVVLSFWFLSRWTVSDDDESLQLPDFEGVGSDQSRNNVRYGKSGGWVP